MSQPNAMSNPPSDTLIGLWEWNLASNSISWDANASLILGVAPGPFNGLYHDFLNIVEMGERLPITTALANALKSGEPCEGEFNILLSDEGNLRRIHAQAIVHAKQGEKPHCVAGRCWEVPLNHRPPAAIAPSTGLASERTLLAALMNHLPDNIYFKDLQSRFIAMNRACAEWTGFKNPKDAVGKTDFDLFTPERAQCALEDEREILRSGLPLVNLEEKEIWLDGQETWVSTTKMPLRDETGRIIGTFGLSRNLTERKQAEKQLAQLARELRAKNEALEEELAMARELQYAMLPQFYPIFKNDQAQEKSTVEFHHFFQPSTAVSGDFFDVFKISDDIAGLFICDVMGHGVRAALVAATTRALTNELRSKWREPHDLMTELNRQLRRTLRHSKTPLFASAFYLVVDLAKGELRYANAGHPKPLHINTQNASCRKPTALDGKSGPVLGLFDDAKYTGNSCEISPQDILLLFTDGLFEVEGENEQIYDYKHLLNAVGCHSDLPMKELCQKVIEEVQAFSANKEFNDDVCLVAMEINSLLKS